MDLSRRIAGSGCRLAVALFLMLGLAGCGSGGEEAGGETTRAEFIEQANLICGEHNEYLRQATIDAFGPDQRPDDETGIRFTREVWIPDIRQQDRELRELEWPPEDRERIDAMLQGILRTADRVEADPELSRLGPFDEATRELTAYGIGPCGSP